MLKFKVVSEERKNHRVVELKESSLFAVQKKTKFLFFFTRWVFVKNHTEKYIMTYEKFRAAQAYINFLKV